MKRDGSSSASYVKESDEETYLRRIYHSPLLSDLCTCVLMEYTSLVSDAVSNSFEMTFDHRLLNTRNVVDLYIFARGGINYTILG